MSLGAVSKVYGSTHAVREVTFDIARGSVHALVGENGAGKSTLSKMLAGVTKPDGGTITIDGDLAVLGSPRQALSRGIAIIDQELALVESRSVLDNVFLGIESHRGGILRQSAALARFRQLQERTGFDLDGGTRVSSLSIGDQQKVEILRALSRDAELIIMDEPTARLTTAEAQHLHGVIRDLSRAGTTVLYISHFLHEVLEVCDTVTVMRDGAHIRTSATAAETEASLVHGMLGRPADVTYPDRRQTVETLPPLLRARSLTRTGAFYDVDLELRPGEIVGVTGLVGSGRSELLHTLFGDTRPDAGEISLDDQRVRFGSPRDAIAAGLMLLPESRKDLGLLLGRSVAENVTLSDLDAVSSRGVLRQDRQTTRVLEISELLDVRGDASLVATLSGGNQQKVMFARCLFPGPRVLLIDEPTRGVDIGAKRAIYDVIVALAEQGMAILMVSSEIEEVVGLAHRTIVMRNGRIVAEMAAGADEGQVLAAAFGARSNQDG